MRFPLLPALHRLIRLACLPLFVLGLGAGTRAGVEYEEKPADPYFKKFNVRRAPAPGPLLLNRGDAYIIAGDSITEQKLYTRIVETYLTVCRPDLQVDVRQLGWSGETVEGFRRRLESDCLRFKPQVVSLFYGMNDAKYRPYDDANGRWFRENLSNAVKTLRASGARVLVASPGIAERPAVWVASRAGTLDEHNLNLGTLRDLALGVAEEENVRFTDVFWPMLKAGFTARARYGGNPENPYALAGKDGIHPDVAGQLIIAYAMLRGLGLDGDLGTIRVNADAGTASASEGHRILSADTKKIVIESTRYPYCAADPVDRDDSVRSGMSLVPFNQELNRLMLVVEGRPDMNYSLKWGDEMRLFSAAQLAAGVNLADEFPNNPFSQTFKAVEAAVAKKQAFETVQVKAKMHAPENRDRVEQVVKDTEQERAKLRADVLSKVIPVTHTLELNRW